MLSLHLIYVGTEHQFLESHILVGFGSKFKRFLHIGQRAEILIEFVILIGPTEIYVGVLRVRFEFLIIYSEHGTGHGIVDCLLSRNGKS